MLLFYIGAPLIISIFEILIYGRKNSSWDLILRFDTTALWDIFSYIIALASIDYLILNFYSLGYFDKFHASTYSAYGYVGQLKSNIILTVVLVVLLDFLMYWLHRLQHSLDWLWLGHKYHHSAQQLTVISWLRSHPLQEIFKAKTVLVFFFGYVIFKHYFFLCYALINMLAHSRLDTNYGFIGKYFLVSPRFHYQHHSINSCQVNFSTGLVIWDRIFGTYKEGAQSVHEVTCGLEEKNYQLNNIWQIYLKPFADFLIYPFIGLLRVLNKGFLVTKTSLKFENKKP